MDQNSQSSQNPNSSESLGSASSGIQPERVKKLQPWRWFWLKLDRYRDYIRSRVEQFDLDATRILLEIQAMGYAGGVHTVRLEETVETCSLNCFEEACASTKPPLTY